MIKTSQKRIDIYLGSRGEVGVVEVGYLPDLTERRLYEGWRARRTARDNGL